MTEYWINNQDDCNEFLSFLKEENLSPVVLEQKNHLSKVKAGNFTVYIPDQFKDACVKTYDPLIFGKNTEECIINITVKDNKTYVFKRIDNEIREEVIDYKPWFLSSKFVNNSTRLKGNQYYKFLKRLDYAKYLDFIKAYDKKTWTPRSIEEGFMLLNGYTYYKGMKISDVSLLSFDIEATTLNPEVTDAHVVLISTTYRKNGKITKKLFEAPNKAQEAQMIQDFEDYTNECDPDIILGHNVLSYDFPYICTQKLLNIGRNKLPIRFEEKISKFRKDATQQYDYHNARIFGREIVDTFFLSIKYDVGRQFPSYGLKKIEKHLNLVEENRIEWDFKKYPTKKVLEEYKNGNTKLWKEFCVYAQDDSDSPIKMFDIMMPAFFYMAQSIPKTLQQMVNEASGSQLDALMVRSYLQEGYSQPRSSTKHEYEGAISMGIPGIYENVRKVDVASLYPSIMLQYNIYDKDKDPRKNMLKILDYFRKERLANKQLSKETNDRYYDDLQGAGKILINSMYGFLGTNYLLYNFPFGASEVTRYGREILQKGVKWATGYKLKRIEKEIRNEGTEDEEISYEWVIDEQSYSNDNKGFLLVNVDTDSFSITNGDNPSKEEFIQDIDELNSLYPELIKWENDGVYDKVIVVKAKNYVLKSGDKIKYKGSAFLSSNKEPILQRLMNELVEIFLRHGIDYERLIKTHLQYSKNALNIQDINDWCTKKTVTKSVLTPKRANEQNVLDAVNTAVKKKVISGVQEGDKIFVYRAIDGLRQKIEKGEPVFLRDGSQKMIDNTILKFPELWANDHDRWHYVERIYDTFAILGTLIDMNRFIKYHNKKYMELLNQ